MWSAFSPHDVKLRVERARDLNYTTLLKQTQISKDLATLEWEAIPTGLRGAPGLSNTSNCCPVKETQHRQRAKGSEDPSD